VSSLVRAISCMVWNAYKPDQLRALTSRVASLVISICSPSRQLLLAIVFLSLLYTSGIHATTPRQCAILYILLTM
jgi:hypothetical protein